MRPAAILLTALALGCHPAAAAADPPPVPAAAPTFPAVLFTLTGKYPHELSAAYGEFTPAGPKEDTLKPLPRGVRHVARGDDGTLYGITNHEVVRLDLAKGTVTEMKVPAGLPELSWACGLAFDAKRGRLLVATLGGVGHLYSYAPKTGVWAVVAELDNVDLMALAHDPRADRLYGLFEPHGGRPTVGTFNAAGALLMTAELPAALFPAAIGNRPTGRPAQLVPVGDRLAVLVDDRLLETDPKTGNSKVTCTRKK